MTDSDLLDMHYFLTEDDDFDQVLDEFGSVYSDEELRLLKIKFLSEMGI